MASFEFKIGEEYAVKLSRYAAKSDEIAKKAIYTCLLYTSRSV